MMDAVHTTRFPEASMATTRKFRRIMAATWRWALCVRLSYARRGPSGLTPELADGPTVLGIRTGSRRQDRRPVPG
jgi:hypothetical protein